MAEALQAQTQAEADMKAAEASAKKKEKEGPKSLGDVTKLYLVPIAMIVISLILLFFLVFPQAGGITERLSSIRAQQEEYTRLVEIRTKRQSLASVTNQQQADLDKIDKIIPQSQTAVVDFSENIREKAEDNNLRMRESVVGEVVTATPTGVKGFGTDQPGLELVELPAEFTITGRFEDIKSFLADIFGGDDFIIIKQMELKKQFASTGQEGDPDFDRSAANNWLISVILVKYQFRLAPTATEEDLRAAYFAVPETLKANQQVLTFINENY